MVRRPNAPTTPDDEAESLDSARRDASSTDPDRNVERQPADLSTLAIAGLTRRRTAALLGALVAVWVIVVFARQVGAASAATARAEQMATDNAALTTQVDAMSRELSQIQQPGFVQQAARAYGLGGRKEIAFALAPDAPPLADDAPGSASVRLGSAASRVSPLDRWLTLLFGPGD
jgi:hypothetical protein